MCARFSGPTRRLVRGKIPASVSREARGPLVGSSMKNQKKASSRCMLTLSHRVDDGLHSSVLKQRSGLNPGYRQSKGTVSAFFGGCRCQELGVDSNGANAPRLRRRNVFRSGRFLLRRNLSRSPTRVDAQTTRGCPIVKRCVVEKQFAETDIRSDARWSLEPGGEGSFWAYRNIPGGMCRVGMCKCPNLA